MWQFPGFFVGFAFGTPLVNCRKQRESRTRNHLNESGSHMLSMTGKTTFGIGGLAFLAGVIATLVTAYAVISKKSTDVKAIHPQYDGWEDGLGV